MLFFLEYLSIYDIPFPKFPRFLIKGEWVSRVVRLYMYIITASSRWVSNIEERKLKRKIDRTVKEVGQRTYLNRVNLQIIFVLFYVSQGKRCVKFESESPCFTIRRRYINPVPLNGSFSTPFL